MPSNADPHPCAPHRNLKTCVYKHNRIAEREFYLPWLGGYISASCLRAILAGQSPDAKPLPKEPSTADVENVYTIKPLLHPDPRAVQIAAARTHVRLEQELPWFHGRWGLFNHYGDEIMGTMRNRLRDRICILIGQEIVEDDYEDENGLEVYEWQVKQIDERRPEGFNLGELTGLDNLLHY